MLINPINFVCNGWMGFLDIKPTSVFFYFDQFFLFFWFFCWGRGVKNPKIIWPIFSSILDNMEQFFPFHFWPLKQKICDLFLWTKHPLKFLTALWSLRWKMECQDPLYNSSPVITLYSLVRVWSVIGVDVHPYLKNSIQRTLVTEPCLPYQGHNMVG